MSQQCKLFGLYLGYLRISEGTSQISNAEKDAMLRRTPASAGASAAVPFVVSAMAGAEVEIDENLGVV